MVYPILFISTWEGAFVVGVFLFISPALLSHYSASSLYSWTEPLLVLAHNHTLHPRTLSFLVSTGHSSSTKAFPDRLSLPPTSSSVALNCYHFFCMYMFVSQELSSSCSVPFFNTIPDIDLTHITLYHMWNRWMNECEVMDYTKYSRKRCSTVGCRGVSPDNTCTGQLELALLGEVCCSWDIDRLIYKFNNIYMYVCITRYIFRFLYKSILDTFWGVASKYTGWFIIACLYKQNSSLSLAFTVTPVEFLAWCVECIQLCSCDTPSSLLPQELSYNVCLGGLSWNS